LLFPYARRGLLGPECFRGTEQTDGQLALLILSSARIPAFGNQGSAMLHAYLVLGYGRQGVDLQDLDRA